MKNLFSILCILCISFLCVKGNTVPDSTRIPDKAFLHLDKTFYAQGDTAWFKAYVFHRDDNELSDNSYSLSIQMLDETGEQVGAHKLLLVGGIGYGQIPIYENMKPGFYQIVAHSAHMKNFRTNFYFKTTIEVRKKYSEMTVKPFYDKDSYKVGDTAQVTFRVYDEFQELLPDKRFRYYLTYKGKILHKDGLKSNDNGSASVKIPISMGDRAEPARLEVSYLIKDTDEHHTTQDYYIPMVKDKIKVGIYPEGGDLIRGLSTKVAFEVTDELGKPVDAQVTILEDESPIAATTTMHKGRGLFSLLPRESKYMMRVTDAFGVDTLVDLPAVRDQGYYLSYFKQNAENVSLMVQHNFGTSKAVNLWVSQNDKLLSTYALNVSGVLKFSLPKAELPAGLVTVTLTDDTNTPCSERMIYVDKPSPQLSLSLPRTTYNERNRVDVTLKLSDISSKAHLSASVIDSFIGNSPNLGHNSILSYAYLQSELRDFNGGDNSYFKGDRLNNAYRDLLIMTHGWSRFAWINNKKRLETLPIYDFNKVKGRVTRRNKPIAHAPMTALVMAGLSFLEFETDDEGWFSIYPEYEDYRASRLTLRAKNSNGKNNVSISLVNSDTILHDYICELYQDELKPLVYSGDLLLEHADASEGHTPFKFYETKLLKELVVEGKQQSEGELNSLAKQYSSFAIGSISGAYLDGGFSFADFVQQASAKALYSETNDIFVIKDKYSESRELIDAEPEFGATDEIGAEIFLNNDDWGINPSQLDFLTKDDIAEIVVLGAQAATIMFGDEGGQYGVVLVRTYSTDFVASRPTEDDSKVVFGGFINSRERYQPDYSIAGVGYNTIVDNRVTLHWEPLIEVNKAGEASFSFYTDDIRGPKQIIVQGMDDDGHFFYTEHSFNVEIVGQ